VNASVRDVITPTYEVSQGLVYLRKLEVQVAFSCNLSCSGCVHGSPASRAKFIDVGDLERDLAVLARHLRVLRFYLLGGEPLLHPQLHALLKVARASGVARQVGILTNGVGLERMPDGFFRDIDFINVSRYPGVRLRFTAEEMDRKAERFGFRFALRDHDEFMTSHLNARIESSGVVERIYTRCKSRSDWSTHTIADGRYYKCSRSPVLEERLRASGQCVASRAGDSVPFRDNPDFVADLVRYLDSPTPMEACHWCLGSDGASFPHLLQNKRQAIAEAGAIVHFSPARHLSAVARSELAGVLDADVAGPCDA